MSITSGLAPIRNYANGGDVNTKRQSMLAKLGFPSGMTNEQLDAAIAEEERISSISSGGNAPKTAGDFTQDFKDYVFDYEDPVDIATLPLYALGPAGIAANRAIKTGRVANKAFKPSGIQSILSNPGVNVGIPSATLAGDVTYDLATDEEFMGDIKTIAGIEDDALDQANEDLKKVNEKEEQEVADAKDMEDESEEEKKGIGALQDQLASFQGMMDPGEMTGGYIMEGSSTATPEIRRYEAGGIASLEPVMMAAGGSARSKIFTEGIKKLIKKVTPKKKDKVEAKKKKSDTKKETKTEKAKRILPPELAVPATVIGRGATNISKEALKKAGGEGGIGRGAARAGIYGGLGLAGYNYLTGDDEKSSEAAEVKLPPSTEKDESDALKDILYQNSLERATSAGRTEPSFVDYLASFPGSYTEKVGKDPEFAKQMMAGFMAMMKPTEGYVPRNALVDFGEAAYAEQARQEGALSDQEKLLRMSDEDISRLQDIQAGAQRLTKESILASGLLLAQFREQLTGDKDGEVYDTNNLNIPLNNISMLALMKELNDDPVELSKRIIRKP